MRPPVDQGEAPNRKGVVAIGFVVLEALSLDTSRRVTTSSVAAVLARSKGDECTDAAGVSRRSHAQTAASTTIDAATIRREPIAHLDVGRSST